MALGYGNWVTELSTHCLYNKYYIWQVKTLTVILFQKFKLIPCVTNPHMVLGSKEIKGLLNEISILIIFTKPLYSWENNWYWPGPTVSQLFLILRSSFTLRTDIFNICIKLIILVIQVLVIRTEQDSHYKRTRIYLTLKVNTFFNNARVKIASLKGLPGRPLSKAFFVQCKLYRYICLILLEKQFVEVWCRWILFDAHISNITCNLWEWSWKSYLCFSVHPTEFIFIVLPFYHVTCVHISKVALTESS